MRTHALILAALAAILAGCGNPDAELVCERLSECGCLTESVDACADRIADQDEEQLELCGHCLETNDYMCHELISNHGACRACTDDFASPGKGRDPQESGQGSGGVDDEGSCVDISTDAGTS